MSVTWLYAPFGFISLLLTACSTASIDCKDQLPQDLTQANAGCLIVAHDKVLLVRHVGSGKLGIPAGTADFQERAACTARRETWEEVGLEVEITRHLTTFSNGFRLYQCKAADHAITDTEHQPQMTRQRSEISEILLLPTDRLSAEIWRFPEQFPAFLEVANAQIAQGKQKE